MLTYGSFTFDRILDFIFAHFWVNGVLYFSLKNLLCQKGFLINTWKEQAANMILVIVMTKKGDLLRK